MIRFSPYLPDQGAFEQNASMDVLNVVPSSSGFRPFPSFSNVTSAITARAQGAISVRGLQGAISNFCGDATKLYKEASDGLSWSDVSRLAGGAYSTASDKWWDFFLFGDIVIATNGNDAPQKFQLDVDSNFAALSGSPITANFGGVIRDFAILARRNTAFNQIKWSALGDAEDWVTSATTLSDAQDFYEGGQIMGFVGGEFGLVFLEKGIFRMAFEGPPTVFRFDKISNALGCRAERSIAAYENLVFFMADDGFYMVRGGSEIIPIGDGKIDRTFETLVDPTYLYRVSSAIDPIRKLYVCGFASTSATSGTPDKMMAYHWPTGQWAQIGATHEIIYSGMLQSSYTIDGLDALSGTIDGLPYPVDSRFYAGAGAFLLASFNTSHQQGFFTGTNLAATIETGDAELTKGKKTMLRALRPMIEGSSVTPSIAIKHRNRLQDNHTTESAVEANSNGVCRVRAKARYHRAVMTVPAASTWNFATGVDEPKYSAMGSR